MVVSSSVLWAQTDIESSKVNTSEKQKVWPEVSDQKPLLSLQDHFGSVLDAKFKKPFDVKNVQSPFSTWIVFQKTCKTCHTMMREQKCFKSKKNNVFFVGLIAKPEALLSAAFAQSAKTQVLYSETDLVASLKLDVTPTVFIFKGDQLIHRHDNYMTCKAIKAQISKHK